MESSGGGRGRRGNRVRKEREKKGGKENRRTENKASGNISPPSPLTSDSPSEGGGAT